VRSRQVLVQVAVAQDHHAWRAVVGVEEADEALSAHAACRVGIEGHDELAGEASQN
jgi:hypothetical protein